VIRTPHFNVLVDSCVGNHKTRPARPAWNMLRSRRYMAQLRRVGLRVEDIDYVLCTHLHPDHVGWNTRLRNGRWIPTFPNAKYIFGKAEYDFWLGRHQINSLPHFEDSVLPIVHRNQAELVASDHQIGDFIKLASAPGHTPDHLIVEIGHRHAEAVLLADAVHSVLQIKQPKLSMCFDFDGEQSHRTRLALFDRLADTKTICCPAHFPAPSIGRIKRNKSAYDWVSCSEC
jgi:glyoxylase-like metal-dependent hydrolase (beta-lactamase superfamily II)